MYKVKIISLEKPGKVSKERMEELKGALKAGMINKMRREAVDCPVLGRQVVFVDCFLCKNFLRRVRGEVDCRGDPL